MTAKPEPLISLDLGPNGGELQFHSAEEIESWVSHEVTFWQWLQKSTSYDASTGPIWSQHAAPWSKLNEKISLLKSGTNHQEKLEHLKAIKEILNNSYKAGRSLHSSTPAAEKLLEFRGDETDKKAILAAAYMLGHFINAPLKIVTQNLQFLPTFITAACEAELFKKGISGISDSERAALDALRETQTRLNNELASKIQQTKELLETTDHNFKSLHASLLERFEQVSGRFDKLYESSSKTLEDIANTYDKKLALQASVTYWTKKAERHRNFSIVFGMAFVLTLIGVGYYGFQELYPFLKNIKPEEKPESWIIALIIISAVVSVWIVRLIVRVLLSHIHLQRDSSERATMLLTYLSLSREGSGLKDDEKKLILQALFRPSASGIIKDDAIPSGIYDFITRPK